MSERNFTKSVEQRSKVGLYRINYTILVESESYPQSVEMPGYNKDDARARWEKIRDMYNSLNDTYIVNDITQIR